MIEWRDSENHDHCGSLFAAFSALARGEARSFPALRPHQREPWHSFTVQVAALALIRAGRDDMPDDEAAWRDLLIALTPEWPDGEAWDLVVVDWSKPALLQPPIVAATDRAAYKNRLMTPDALDMLVTAKNHDVKQERMVGASEQDWLFALVTLQTTEGFLGAGNYGVSRMNGGFASRMSLGVRPIGGAGFRRDVRRLVEDARARPDRRGGIPLLWTVPWDGTVSLSYADLDELYVEICRRVRLQRSNTGTVQAMAAGSKCARVAAADLKGITGDPWAPVKADRSSSHTPTGAGFGYRQMATLLDQAKITRPLLAEPHDGDDRQGLSIVAAALVRGQGKTEGLHRRSVPVSRWETISAYEDAPLDRIGAVATKRAGDAGEAGRRLGRALISLVQGGPEKARLDDDAAKKKTERWLEQFNRVVDAEFFDVPFWAEAAGDDGNHRLLWRTRLRSIASDVFDTAAEAAPRTEVRRIRAIARARAFLDGQMGKWMKDVQHGE
ncbi:type I-E CRISPR-associated protein Cse1/CasA [Sphingomonas fuzhouensis]|uniref:type I-E CRISPR-associated protein Cse1/CasA n=1 Tax=Sphingomonas fuzhouensis TaxID=3106033 RepID=UPI002AFDCAD0|nr:type I-E CRISPR-associated protein Cse1/CasA [Sphingomonas sp. SGZ-02]